MPNINDPVFDESREQPGFRAARARLSRQAGGERLGLSLWELPPREAAYPYHHHLGEEELIVVLDGRPSLRTPEGWRELAAGEVVAFPRGERGAHQLVNLRTGDVPGFKGGRLRRLRPHAIGPLGAPRTLRWRDSRP